MLRRICVSCAHIHVVGIPLRSSISIPAFALIFLGACAVNSIGIGVPAYWHPDELGKAAQIQGGLYNFFHPQLMLRLTELVTALFQPDSTRNVILAGRSVSVIASAVAATAFGILVARRFGLAFGMTAAILVGLTPTVFIHAHHFKEDATLLMTTALVMLTLQSVDINPSRRNIILLGLAAGLAMSSKYVGGVMILPAAAMLIAKRVRWTDAGLCLAAAIAVFVAINSPGVFGTSSLSTGFLVEFHHVRLGHDSIPGSRLTLNSLANFWRSMTPPLVALWIAGIVLQLLQKWPDSPGHESSRLAMTDRIVAFTPVLLLAMLQAATFSNPRYVLPAVALAIVAAVWTVAWIIDRTGNRAARIVSLAMLVLGSATTLSAFRTAILLAADDPRTKLAEWISRNLPADARIATEFYTGLPTPERVSIDPTVPLLPQFIVTSKGHLGTHGLDKLYEQGVTHIVLSSANYSRFFVNVLPDALVPTRTFYETVFSRFKPVYDSPVTSDAHYIAASRLSVYDIRKPAVPQNAASPANGAAVGR